MNRRTFIGLGLAIPFIGVAKAGPIPERLSRADVEAMMRAFGSEPHFPVGRHLETLKALARFKPGDVVFFNHPYGNTYLGIVTENVTALSSYCSSAGQPACVYDIKTSGWLNGTTWTKWNHCYHHVCDFHLQKAY